MSQYSSPEAVLVPGPVTLVGPLEAAVDAFFVAVLFFEVSFWANAIVAARTIITSKNQVLSIYVLQFSGIPVVVQLGKEVSQTRDYCVAKNATLRAARPDPSLRKERLLRKTIKLHHCIFRQPRHFDSRSGWRSRAEIFPVHFVHCRKIIHILQKDGGAHNLLQTAASRLQNAGKISHRSIRLRSYIACNELLVRRINRHLPRYKNESVCPDRL